jgi:hypothetical protein
MTQWGDDMSEAPRSSTIAIRLPTTRPPASEGAPAFTLDAPIAGKVVGVRTDLAWRSWQLIGQRWCDELARDGATTVAIQTGAQVGKEGTADRATVSAWSDQVDCGIVGLGTCGSCTSFSVYDAVALEQHDKPSVVVVCSEFETHARNMARFLGHPNLKVLVLPYPLEALPEQELVAIADEYYPQALELLGAKR